MNNSLLQRCNSFTQNKQVIKNTFNWESSYIYPVCAAIFTEKNKTASAEELIACKNILKNQTGVFSNFRGNVKLAIISMLAVDNNPEEKLKNGLKVYDVLKQHFWGSEYLSLAAMVIADLVEPERYEQIAARTRVIYNMMKEEHPFLTSSEDSVFAALLTLSDLSEQRIVDETEKCYSILKQEFSSSNAVQSLSHVLALGEGSAQEKCKKTIDLYYALREQGCKYGKQYELATLGVLALLPVEQEVLVRDMIEVDNYLSRQKGYGLFGLDKKQRLMHAAMLVSGEYIEQNNYQTMNSAAIAGTVSLIAAQQAAMCAAIAASSAAAAGSASSS